LDNLYCPECRRSYDLDDPVWRCVCGSPLDIEIRSRFSRRDIRPDLPGMWRYRNRIPVRQDENIVTFHEGYSPLYPLEIGSRTALVKMDHVMPTGSFKDRGASVMVSKIKELRVKKAVIDSSGNAAASVAAYCARAGIACEVYAPVNTPAGKLAQIRSSGARLRLINGTREETACAARKAAARTYYASHYWNPFFFQGTKTFAYEVCEQLGWRAPDAVVLPCGNGTLFLGAYLGFLDLRTAKVIGRMPRMIAVQAANCAPLRRAIRGKGAIRIRPTLAEGIAIAEPVRAPWIINAVGETSGAILAVSEKEIKAALRDMARLGFFIEPTAAATIAGLKQYLAGSQKNEVVVSVFSGHGLKTAEKVDRILRG
jgi:threonine synthase